MLTIKHVSAPRFSKADGSAIDVTLSTKEHGVVQYTATAADDPYGIFAQATAGRFGVVTAHTADPIRVRALSRRQFMLGLYVWGLLDRAEAAVAAAGGVTKIAWDSTTSFSITDPVLVSLAESLGLGEQLKDFFDFAATL